MAFQLQTRQLHPLVAFLLAVLLALPLALYAVYLYIAPSLPNVAELKTAPIEVPMTVYTQDGKLIGEYGDRLSIPVTYDDLPPDLVKALLAAEDASFFEHSGVSFRGLGRALTESVQSGAQTGGSTITMQVAKNFYLSPERTIKRKLTEIFLARKIEQELSKKDIMTLYVNKIFLGQHAYGVAAAAQKYYSKRLNQLSLAEMAMIAGLPKAPSSNNPVVNPERALERRNWILGRMFQLGFISQQAYQQARSEPITLKLYERRLDYSAPYLAEMVRIAMVEQFGESVLNSGFKIYTTVTSERQTAADRAVKAGLEAYDMRHGWHGIESPAADNKPLSKFLVVGELLPVKVTKVNDRSFEAEMLDGSTVTVPWRSMGWLRKRINSDRQGAMPGSFKQMLKVGDIVRIRDMAHGRKPGTVTMLKPAVATEEPIENDTADDSKAKKKNTKPSKPSKPEYAIAQLPLAQGQLISMDPDDGSIEAVVGGYDYNMSKFNRSTQGWRQPGSTIKPFIYTLALEKGMGPYSTVKDTPLRVGKWSPQNSDGRFLGSIPMRQALYLSRNLVSVRLLQYTGIGNARNFLTTFGFTESDLPDNLTLALGTAQVLPLQMATGYSAFANGGYRVQPYFIERVTDLKDTPLYTANPIRVCRLCGKTRAQVEEMGAASEQYKEKQRQAEAQRLSEAKKILRERQRKGEKGLTLDGVLAELPKAKIKDDTKQIVEPMPESYRQAERIIRPKAAYDIASMLHDVVTQGTGRAALKIGRSDLGGKTGTTNEARDAWFAGFHPRLVAVASVGFDQPEPLGRSEFGGIAALPIWSNYMKEALTDVPVGWINRDGSLQKGKLTQEQFERRQKEEARKTREAAEPPMAVRIYPEKPANVLPIAATAAVATAALVNRTSETDAEAQKRRAEEQRKREERRKQREKERAKREAEQAKRDAENGRNKEDNSKKRDGDKPRDEKKREADQKKRESDTKKRDGETTSSDKAKKRDSAESKDSKSADKTERKARRDKADDAAS